METTLNSLTDKQIALICQFAYLNIKTNFKPCLFKNLKSLIDSKLWDQSIYGNLISKTIQIPTTYNSLVDELIKNGLGDFTILNSQTNDKSSFSAIIFKDFENNVGMTIRGTEVNNLWNLFKDSIVDINEFSFGSSSQVKYADSLYNEFKPKYIFGHSLGANLAEHLFLEYPDEINKVYEINPFHVNKKFDEGKYKNNVNKISCYVIGGDWVSKLRTNNTIKSYYIFNNKSLTNQVKNSPIESFCSHAIESASFVGDSFDYAVDYSDAYKDYEESNRIIDFMLKIAKPFNNILNLKN